MVGQEVAGLTEESAELLWGESPHRPPPQIPAPLSLVRPPTPWEPQPGWDMPPPSPSSSLGPSSLALKNLLKSRGKVFQLKYLHLRLGFFSLPHIISESAVSAAPRLCGEECPHRLLPGQTEGYMLGSGLGVGWGSRWLWRPKGRQRESRQSPLYPAQEDAESPENWKQLLSAGWWPTECLSCTKR